MRIYPVILLAIFCLFGQVSAQSNEAALWDAARNGDVKLVQQLIDEGVDVNAQTEYGATALSYAADRGFSEVVRLLLENGAQVNAMDSFYKVTPIVWAAYKGNLEVVRLMIEHGADLSSPKPLQWASFGGHTGVVELLLQHGAAGAASALNMAIRNDKEELALKVLASARIDTNDLSPALANARAKQLRRVVQRLEALGVEEDAAGTTTVPVAELEQYTGTFASDAMAMELKLEAGRLLALVPGQEPFSLIRTQAHHFEVAEMADVTFQFEVGEQGATGFILNQGGQSLQFSRTPDRGGEGESPPTVAESGVELVSDADVKAPENWASFRGNRASGVADGQFPPTVWNAAESLNIAWKTPIQGLAHSSPIVWDDRIFVTTAISSDSSAEYRVGLFGDVDPAGDMSKHIWRIYCVDKNNGDIIWQHTPYEGMPRTSRHIKASQANSTPATNGKYVVALFGSEGLCCYDLDGNLVWKKDLGVLDAGWFFDDDIVWGHASSPVIYKDRVIVQCDRSSDSYIAAYELDSGKQIWRTARNEIPSWGTPTVVDGARREVVTNGSRFVRAYDPLTGDELWRHKMDSEITVATPVASQDLVYVTAGYPPNRPVIAIRTGGTGDITIADTAESAPYVAWRKKRGGTYMPTPIVYDGYLYTCSNNGILTCYEARTGKQMYRERVAGRGGYAFSASPIAANGKLYVTSEEGDVFVVRTGPRFELIAQNHVGEVCMATPAISDGMLFIRGQHHLFGISGQLASRQ